MYSLKANPNRSLCKVISNEDIGAEISSGGELHIALSSAFSPSEIVASGPGKTTDELDYYISNDIWMINCESEAELKRINTVAKRFGKSISVGLRINPNKIGKGAKAKMGGKATQFGIDEKRIDEVLTLAKKLDNVSVCGIHVYCGTQILSSQIISENCRYIACLAKQIIATHNIQLKVVNFGGGLGIPFSAKEKPLNIHELCKRIHQICKELRNTSGFENTLFVLETGRFLIGTSGVFVCRVQDVKKSRGKTYIIIDGGINNFMSLSPLFRWARTNPINYLLKQNGTQDRKQIIANIVGPLCTTIDICSLQQPITEPKIDDIIVFGNAGAYSLSMSPVLFLGRPMPAEVLVSHGKESIIRQRGSFKQLIGEEIINS